MYPMTGILMESKNWYLGYYSNTKHTFLGYNDHYLQVTSTFNLKARFFKQVWKYYVKREFNFILIIKSWQNILYSQTLVMNLCNKYVPAYYNLVQHNVRLNIPCVEGKYITFWLEVSSRCLHASHVFCPINRVLRDYSPNSPHHLGNLQVLSPGSARTCTPEGSFYCTLYSQNDKLLICQYVSTVRIPSKYSSNSFWEPQIKV